MKNRHVGSVQTRRRCITFSGLIVCSEFPVKQRWTEVDYVGVPHIGLNHTLPKVCISADPYLSKEEGHKCQPDEKVRTRSRIVRYALVVMKGVVHNRGADTFYLSGERIAGFV